MESTQPNEVKHSRNNGNATSVHYQGRFKRASCEAGCRTQRIQQVQFTAGVRSNATDREKEHFVFASQQSYVFCRADGNTENVAFNNDDPEDSWLRIAILSRIGT